VRWLIYDELYSYLLAQPALVVKIETKIFPDVAPQKVTAPYMVSKLNTVTRNHAMQQDSKLSEFTFQYSITAKTRKESKEISEIVRGLLQNYVGTNIKSVLLDNEFDTYDEATTMYISVLEFRIFYLEV
jgi:hypothetical protein